MTRAEQDTIERFCQELALALRRITGRMIEFSPQELPVAIEDVSGTGVEQEQEVEPGPDEKDVES